MTEILKHQANVLASASILGEQDFDRVWRMSVALAKSGMFKDVTQAEQAFGRILLGADLGLTPTQALMSVDVVRGNVQVRSVRLAAWVRQHPDYDYKVVEHDDQHCVIDFYYKGEVEGTSAFSDRGREGRALKPESPWMDAPAQHGLRAGDEQRREVVLPGPDGRHPGLQRGGRVRLDGGGDRRRRG
jgi:hypothetical protein